MSTKKQNDILRAPASILLAFIFLFGQTAPATQGQNGKDRPDSKPAAKSQQAPTKPSTATEEKIATAEDETVTAERSSAEGHSRRGGQHEGIKVHGHWAIEVRNSDGSLVTHREFENSLDPEGSALVGAVLSGTFVPGVWEVVLDGAPEPCLNPQLGNPPTSCIIAANGAGFSQGGGFPSTEWFFNLQISGPGHVVGRTDFVLNGTAIAAEVTNISKVSTFVTVCDSTYTPTTCLQSPNFLGGLTLTSTGVAPPIQVSTGQTIAVTVTISFS